MCTEIPVGLCVIRTAVSRLFTFWPPAPPDFANCISRSSLFSSTASVAVIFGSTSTNARRLSLIVRVKG
jgi:hypothetical protein